MCNRDFKARRGKRGGKKVKVVESERRKWQFFSDKVDILDRQLRDLQIDTLIHKLERTLSDCKASEMVVVNTPTTAKEVKTTKVRTPLPTLTCDVANCSFTCKQAKRMRDHKTEAHEISGEESLMDASAGRSKVVC